MRVKTCVNSIMLGEETESNVLLMHGLRSKVVKSETPQ